MHYQTDYHLLLMHAIFLLLRRAAPLAFLSLIFVAACSPDQSAEDAPPLEGRWEIDHALRNGRNAESLVDLYFRFGGEDAFSTNISGNDEAGTYQREAEQVTTAGVSMPLTYHIHELTDSSLNLRATASGFRFEFFLRRAADEAPENPAS